MKSIFRALIGVLAFSVMFSANSAENTASELKSRCQNITTQQRQMAEAAGFDINQMCSKLGSAKNESSENKELRTERPDPSESMMNEGDVFMLSRVPGDERDEQSFLNLLGEFENNNKLQSEDGEVELDKYGYNLFAGTPTTFAPVTNVPVPVNYVLGVGDALQIQLLGKIDSSYDLPINRDGSINFPELGPINLAGLEFTEAKLLIKQKVSSQMIGVNAHVTLGELRSIHVFVSGEAFTPGAYTVSSLSTMMNAIFVSGGVTEIASLRNIQLKRKGKLISTLDLYDLLQRGDNSGDSNLEDGDVIYIPTVSKTVSVRGEVNRPAIYEIIESDTLGSLIEIAGGYSGNAYPDTSYILRNNQQGFKTVVDADLTNKKLLLSPVNNGDDLTVGSTLEQVEDVITLSGHFHRPRQMKWRKGLKVSDLIKSVSEFQDNPELAVALIIRKEMPLRKISVLHFDVEDMLANPEGANNLTLEPLDEIIVLGSDSAMDLESDEDIYSVLDEDSLVYAKFEQGEMIETESDSESEQELNIISEKAKQGLILVGYNKEREEILKPLVKTIQQQASNGSFAQLVEIMGNVKFPGVYPKSKNMTVRDLVLIAGGLEEATYLGNVEVTRRDMNNSELASIQHININLGQQLRKEDKFYLEAKDKIAIYVTPEFSNDLKIQIEGQVKFPGTYEFKQGETLSQVIQRAGGFNAVSHMQAAIFTREDLRLQEQKQLNDLRDRLKRDIVASDLEEKAAGKSSGAGDAEQLLNALGETEAIGRLVIDLEQIMSGKSIDLQLKPGDRLIIPSFRQEVSVLGEVQHSTSHVYNKEWVIDDYLESSGGLTKRADDNRIYVVRADGSVFLPNQGGWLTHHNSMLESGDTIVVPQDTDRIKSLTLWTSISQIVYQLSLGAAAINQLTKNN